MSDDESTGSIASFEDDEPEVKPISKKQTNVTKDGIELTKNGKPKRVMSEAQKKALAAARVKGRLVRKEQKELRDREKSIKKDSHLIRKLEVEAKILEHEERKKALFIKAGYVPELKAKKRAEYGSKKKPEEDHDEDEIKALEEKLALMRSKKIPIKTLKVQEAFSKSLTKKGGSGESSASESETESEEEEPKQLLGKAQQKGSKGTGPFIERAKQKKPEMESLDLKHKAVPDPMMRNKVPVDPAMLASLRSLFPNYQH